MAKHRLVTIGDSLTQGFMSGAVSATDLSYPVMIAEAMGIDVTQFRVPGFNVLGGLPINLEYLLRRLEHRYGPDLNLLERLGAPFQLRSWMDEVEDYWERGGGTYPINATGTYHNLASWGMTVDDVLNITAAYCAQRCAQPVRDNWHWDQVPENAFYRTLLRVLNPAQLSELGQRTVLTAVGDLARDGGIENLLVALGSNNALGTVTRLTVNRTEDRVLADPLGSRELYNLWQPRHFEVVYRKLVAELDRLAIDRVFLATVPHVTIAPLARGVGTGKEVRLAADERYFKFYTYFWIRDTDFRATEHPHLKGEEAREIDATIDAYNDLIRAVVRERQAQGRNWFVVDISAALDRMAFRRYREIGREPPGGPYQFPQGWRDALQAAGIPELTTKFLATNNGRITQGGLFSLDGVHATTMGYSLMAHEFIRVMRGEANVPFVNPLTGKERPDPIELDYARILRRDTLVRVPPGLLDDVMAILNWLEDWLSLGRILSKLA